MTEFTFEELPMAVSLIANRLEKIEQLLTALSNPAQPEADQFLTIQQVSEILSLSVPTIYGLVHRAEIPSCKRGKRLYFSKKELTDWIKAGRKKTKPEIEKEADTYLQRNRKSAK